MVDLQPHLELALAVPVTSSRERDTQCVIALRARADKLATVIDPSALAEQRRKLRDRADKGADTTAAFCDLFEEYRQGLALLERESCIIRQILATTSEEHAAAVRAGDGPNAGRAHAQISRASRLEGKVEGLQRDLRQAWRAV